MTVTDTSLVTEPTSQHFHHWLNEQQISLAFTTYESNRLFFVGCEADNGQLAMYERPFDKPTGLYWHDATDRLILTCRYQIWQLINHLQPGQTYKGADRLYAPKKSWVTGDVSAHDVVIDRHGRTLFINTRLSCLSVAHPDARFESIWQWQPSSIKSLQAPHRYYLNGLALQDGEATYITVCPAISELAGGYNAYNDGMVLHIPSNEIIATGLSMPHSPRWYQGKLWLLSSGSGEFGYLDGESFIPICFCPGFVRGVAFYGRYALVGLSRLSSNSPQLEQQLKKRGLQAQCGLLVIDLNTGQITNQLIFNSLITELFDIVVLLGIRQPRTLDLQDKLPHFYNSSDIDNFASHELVDLGDDLVKFINNLC